MILSSCEQECIPEDTELLDNWMLFKTTHVQGDSTMVWNRDTVTIKKIDTYYCDMVWERREFLFNRTGTDSPAMGMFRLEYDVVGDSIHREPPPYSSVMVDKYTYSISGDILLFERTYSDTVRNYDYHVRISDTWLNSLLNQIP